MNEGEGEDRRFFGAMVSGEDRFQIMANRCFHIYDDIQNGAKNLVGICLA
jgi:hypothetical protein